MERDLQGEVASLDKRVGNLETKYDGLDGRVDSLEKWIPILIQDNKDTLRMLNDQITGIRSDVNKSNDVHREIVKDASTRVPKWAMWLFGSLTGLLIVALIGVGGWVVEAIILHH